MPVLAVFGRLDWTIVLLYFALVLTVGVWVGRKDSDEKSYFLGNRSMPTWAVAVSLVATMLSTATFVGVPDIAFGGDFTYLSLNIGGIIAVFIVGFVFVPRLYRAATVTIYGFLAQRFGEPARLAVSCCFIFGRMLSSGARLFLASIPLCLLMYGAEYPSFGQFTVAITLIGVIGTIYATIGGVRAVVWVDTIQFAIVVGTAILSIFLLYKAIHHSPAEIVDVLATTRPANGIGSKLALIDTSLNFAKPYTLWAAIFGNTFLMVAAYGVDHDLAQRFLIAKSPARGAFSVIASQFIGIAVVGLFLCIGMLLYLFYSRPDFTGAATRPMPRAHTGMYPWFLLNELPTGLAGLSIAGLFAVAQGSLDSAMNALASSIVGDIWLPLRKHHGKVGGAGEHASKLTVAMVGGVLILFALMCAALYNQEQTTLLDFALGVMSFALSGMLAVFLTALLTKRGNSNSVIAALVTGAVAVALMQDRILAGWSGLIFGTPLKLAWPWTMPIGTIAAFLVCICGRPAGTSSHGFEVQPDTSIRTPK